MLRLRSARTTHAIVRPERSATRAVEGRWTSVAFLPLLLAACAPEPAITLDGSSPDRFAATVAQARARLAPADRLAFDQALASVGNRRHAANADTLRRTTFDGMTGEEIAQDYRRRTR